MIKEWLAKRRTAKIADSWQRGFMCAKNATPQEREDMAILSDGTFNTNVYEDAFDKGIRAYLSGEGRQH